MQKKIIYRELIFIIPLLIFSFLIAWFYMDAQTDSPFFYQKLFEPGVMMACGHGFGVSVTGPNPALTAFLDLKTSSFSCAQLPKDLVLNTQAPVHAWYYMMWSTAQIWKIFGISWHAVNILLALLFSFSSAFAYGCYRIGMGRALATLGALLFSLSIANQIYLMDLRDYSKAPFILFAIFMLLVWVSRKLAWRWLLISAAVYGAVIGFGYGFRPDALIAIPPALITLFFFMPGGFLKKLPRNLGLIVIMILSFLLVSKPVFDTYKNKDFGSCQWHFAQLGLSVTYTQKLHLRSSVYDWGYRVSDMFVNDMVNSYGNRVLGLHDIAYCSHHYDVASGEQYFEILKTFPGDIIARAYSSVLRVLKVKQRIGFDHSGIKVNFESLVMTAILLLVLAYYNLRWAFFGSLGLFYFMGYPAVQFNQRHYFHLLFWQFWPIGFFIQRLYEICFSSVSREYFLQELNRFRDEPSLIWKKFRRVGFFSLIAVLLLIAPLSLARYWQEAQVKKLVTTYLKAPITALDVVENFQNNKKIKYDLSSLKSLIQIPPTDVQGISAQMLYLELSQEKCANATVSLTIHYQAQEKENDFTRTLLLHLSPQKIGAFKIFMPIFFVDRITYPTAISVPSNQGLCISRVGFVTDNHFYTLWLTLLLPQDWQNKRLYMRF